MIVIKSTKIVYFDVDNTLIYSESEVPGKMFDTTLITISNVHFYIHNFQCELLKSFKARGHTVVVWSQGGADWAETIVRATNLTAFVDLVIGKPDWFCDDKPADQWLDEKRRFFVGEEDVGEA